MKTEKTFTDRQIDSRIKKLADIDKELKELKKEYDRIKDDIIAGMSSDTVTTQNYSVKYSTYEQKRIDTTSLKKELPEIADQFTKITYSHRFTYSTI